MARTNQSIGVNHPPNERRVRFNPQLNTPPTTPMQIARPPPPGAPRSVKKLTGSSPKIPPRTDPLNTYHNIQYKESATGEKEKEETDYLVGINRLMVGVVLVAAISSVFVLPKPLKVFWLLTVAITVVMHIGFHLYSEWMALGQGSSDDEKKYAEWAKMLLYVLVMLYTAVMSGLLFFMIWSLYSIANSKSNIARLDEEAMTDYENEQKSSRAALHSMRESRKKKTKNKLSRMYT